jgi:hypothetical protein
VFGIICANDEYDVTVRVDDRFRASRCTYDGGGVSSDTLRFVEVEGRGNLLTLCKMCRDL